MKNILIIGGSRFQGPYLLKNLLKKNYKITVFHTGNNLIKPHKNVQVIVGNRNNITDLATLNQIKFDSCIDTCAYFPHQIENLALNIQTSHYTLISSIYALENNTQIINEATPLKKNTDHKSLIITKESYGNLKAECERMAKLYFGQKTLIIRPSPVFGPGDHTQRMAFWIRFIAIHKKNICIENLEKKIQLIDVEALTSFTTQLVDHNFTGEINVSGNPSTIGLITNEIIKISNTSCTTCKISIEELHKLGIIDIPYFNDLQTCIYDNSKSIALGLNLPTLQESIKNIYLAEKEKGFLISKNLNQESKLLKLIS